MTDKKNWHLQPGVAMSPEAADDVAKIACALKALSIYTALRWNARTDRKTCRRSWTRDWK